MSQLLERTGVGGGDSDWDHFLALSATAEQLATMDHSEFGRRLQAGSYMSELTGLHPDFPTRPY